MKITHVLLLLFVLLLVGSVLGCTNSEMTQSDLNVPNKSIENAQRSAESSAQIFAQNINREDYLAVFDMLLPGIQQIGNKVAFEVNMKEQYYSEAYGVYLKRDNLIFDRVLLEDETHGWVYYITTDGETETKLPSIEIFYINSDWKFNTYANRVTCEDECTQTGFYCASRWGNLLQCIDTDGDSCKDIVFINSCSNGCENGDCIF